MKILAIDDNPDNLTALKAVVSDRLPGVTVLTAHNGPKGIEIAQAENPDVILLDIVMPDMDGYAICRKLKADERMKTIPVLFLTALKTDRDSRIKALKAGGEGFLSKPFDELELSAQIQAMAKIKAAALAQQNDKERLAGLVAERTRALQQSQNSMLNLLEDVQNENLARKISEEALQRNEIELRCVLETSTDGILAIDSHGKVIHANQRFNEIWQIPSHIMDAGDDHVLLGHVMQQLTDPAAFLAKVQMLYNSTLDAVDTLTFKDGRLIERSSSPLLMDGKLFGRVWTFRDVTERKRTEDAMAKQLDELRRWQTVTLGRENRIGQLKREVNALAARLGQQPPYATPDSP
jgi:DNA-binding response OmpR family regulator